MVKVVRQLGAFVACTLWCCAVRAHSYKAGVMHRTIVDSPKPRQRDPWSGLTAKGYERQKKRNQERMSKCKPMPSMVGIITRVGFGGFQFTEYDLDGDTKRCQAIMRGRFSVDELRQHKGQLLRVHIARHSGRAPILVSVSALSRTTIENLERNNLL